MGLLKDSQDPLVLAVASHDIGQYVKHYERGKKYISSPWRFPANIPSRILTDLGAKTRVMELMSHSDNDVRYHALISVQRLVSHPWTNT